MTWINLQEHGGLKIGDSVRRCDGACDYKGDPFATEGVVVGIEKWEGSGFVGLDVAENGDRDIIIALQPDQVEKIEKNFQRSKDGQGLLI